jgi:hypothetical protein
MSVYPGIAELKAEPPMPDHGPLWQINGRIEGGDSDDPEAWGWLAEVSSGWDDKDGGELARFLVKAANSHDPLIEALEAIERHHVEMNRAIGRPEARSKTLSLTRAALALVRGAAHD